MIPLGQLCDPTPDEIDLFAGRFPPEQTLAVLSLAKRLGIAASLARAMLERAMETESSCVGPGPDATACGRPLLAKGLCAGHYHQQRRKEPLTPLKFERGQGEGEKVRFTAPAELKDAVEADAKVEGVEPSEWWRRAGRERLERRKK